MIYDLVIVGAGPAGLTAAIYAARYKIKHLVIGKELGGAMAKAPMVENYPGFTRLTGLKLAQKMAEQAQEFGSEIKPADVTAIGKNKDGFFLTVEKETLRAKSLIIATGTLRQELGVPGEKEYVGKGISYCTTCDANFFQGKEVAVIGGANAAVMGAVHLAALASKVYLIYRKKPLRAEPMWVDRVVNNPRIEIIYETNVTKVIGDGDKVTNIELDNPYRRRSRLPLSGIFIEIGGVPGADLGRSLGVEVDEKGFVKVSPEMATNVEGVFAAGDIANVSGEFNQIIIACAEGARAALSVYKYLNK